MKEYGRLKFGIAIAGFLLAGTVLAQAPGGLGMGPGPGFEEHRPPMERALGPQGDRGRWWNNSKVAEQLKLTDEQRKTFDGIMLEHRSRLIDLRANVEKAELEMEPLVGADQPNETRILAQIDKVAQARAELEKANARFLLAIRSKLTPEQWKQVQAFRANHGPEREGREFERPGHDGQRPGGQHHRPLPPLPPLPPPPPGMGLDAPPVPPEAPASGSGDEQ